MTALARAGWLLLCGALPLVSLYYAVAPVVSGDRDAVDFHFNYFHAAEAVLAGEDFYREAYYVYPPPLALATTPWTLLPVNVAEAAFTLLLVAVFAATLAVLGVRDWRCYGLAFLSPAVGDAVTIGNITIVLGLAAAVVWRSRDRAPAAGAAAGLGIATKLLLWPLVVWLAASGRRAAALWSIAVGAVTVLASWAILGFQGFLEYPDTVRRISDRMDERGYTVYALGLDLGLSSGIAKILWALVAVGVLFGVVLAARRGDDRRAFVLVLAAAIACSPIVWLHYLVFAHVAVAVVQPRLGLLWFVGLPLQLLVSTGVDNGDTRQTTLVLVTTAVTFALALLVGGGVREREAVSSPAAARP